MTRKYDYKFIKAKFDECGYELLSESYNNAHGKLMYICPSGHKHNITWNHWQSGHRCPYCAKQGKLIFDQVKQIFHKEGYVLLTNNYVNSQQKLEYICPNGHTGSIRLHNWVTRKSRCIKCAAEKRAAKYHRKPFKEIVESFKSNGYELLSKHYKNCKQKLKCICPAGHKYQITWHNWNGGIRCPKCFDGSSKWEKEVRLFIDELGIEYIPNDKKTLLNPNTKTALEIDIWMPDMNKAIECNGVYWHSFDDKKQTDQIKTILCAQLNIELLTITDAEWNSNKQLCKSKISEFLLNNKQ